MKFTDQIKAKAEELDLSGKIDSLGAAAKEALADAKSKAGEVAHDQKAKVEELLEKAGSAIDEKTDGKYSERVAQVKTKAGDLVDRVASHRPGADIADADSAEEPGETPETPETPEPAKDPEPEA